MKQPNPIIGLYRENPTRPGIHDFVKGQALPFHHFRISEPQEQRFEELGTKWILETWTDGDKEMFTGLRCILGNVLYGDLLDKKGRRSIFFLIPEGGTLQVHYFTGYYPRSIRRRNEFIGRYFQLELFAAGSGSGTTLNGSPL